MRSRSRILTSQQRQALLEAIIDRYERAPEVIEKALPEVGKILSTSCRAVKRSERGGIFQLTPVERQRREQSLAEALGKLHRAKAFSKEEAIQALEDAASLKEAFPYEDHKIREAEIRKLVNIATGLSVTTKGKVTKHVFQEGEPARTVCMLRGVKLNLTWDKKLMSVEVDPKELAIRARALSLIGIGSDTASDVAARHDDYFVEAISDR